MLARCFLPRFWHPNSLIWLSFRRIPLTCSAAAYQARVSVSTWVSCSASQRSFGPVRWLSRWHFLMSPENVVFYGRSAVFTNGGFDLGLQAGCIPLKRSGVVSVQSWQQTVPPWCCTGHWIWPEFQRAHHNAMDLAWVSACPSQCKTRHSLTR